MILAVFVCGSQCWQLCTCTLACLWQDSVQMYYHHLSLHNVNVAVSGGGGALVRKLVFSGGCATGLVKKCKVHTHWNCVWSQWL